MSRRAGSAAARLALHGRNLATLAGGSREARRRVARRYFFDAAGRYTSSLVSQGAHRYLVSTRDRSIGRAVFSQGDYELDVMARCLEVLGSVARRNILRDAAFVDVGANIGTSVVPACLTFGARRAVAVEPSPHNYQLLKCNVLLNGLESKVACVQAAVTSKAGSVVLELSDANSGDNRVRVTAGLGRYREEDRDVVTVPALRLDDVIRREGLAPDQIGVVWVDTQGHEAAVLESAPDILRAGVPFVTEYWPYGLERSLGLARFHELVGQNFASVIDVRAGTTYDPRKLDELADVYSETDYTDLVLVPERILAGDVAR